MAKNTSIALGTHFEEFVSNSLDSGRYQSASEVIRAGLRMLEESERKRNAIISALEKGEKSGFVEDFNPDELLKEIHAKNVVG